MLVRFSVKNYRSFRDEQVLSLEAGRQGLDRKGRSFSTGHKSAPHLLRAAVIYGANSGGKSNLVRAMCFMHEFVSDSAREGQTGDKLDVEPYRLDPEYSGKPSEFEIVFIVNGILYQYGFAVCEEKVHAEWLYETPQEGRIRHVFSRELKNKSGYDWYINSRVRGERKLWQESTRSNALFLSTAMQLNSSEFENAFHWLSKQFRVLLGQQIISHSVTSHRCHAHDSKHAVLQILQAVDGGIVDLFTEEEEFTEKSIPDDIPDQIRAQVIKTMKGQKIYHAGIGRRSSNGSIVRFDLDDESTGTNVLYNLAGPWLDTLCYGFSLVIDELDSGLHPLALQVLVAMFFDSVQNTSNAQLIITCHEATLMREQLLRTDQIWFIDRTVKDGSRLYPLSEFKPRQNESFLRGYLGGRYGGIPVTKSIAQ